EGRQEGRHQGRQEGRRQDILRLLEVRFGTVPQGIREAVLEEGAPSRLDLLFDAAITSADLESFAAGL
ncbi:MAG: transposase, partial [Verrucomicrobia bacterium]|nr:transposase [Verrucomicrobiota bacterium]